MDSYSQVQSYCRSPGVSGMMEEMTKNGQIQGMFRRKISKRLNMKVMENGVKCDCQAPGLCSRMFWGGPSQKWREVEDNQDGDKVSCSKSGRGHYQE